MWVQIPERCISSMCISIFSFLKKRKYIFKGVIGKWYLWKLYVCRIMSELHLM